MWDRLAVRMGVRRSNSCNLHPDLTSPPDCGYQGGPLEEAPACLWSFRLIATNTLIVDNFSCHLSACQGPTSGGLPGKLMAHTRLVSHVSRFFIPVFVRFEEDGSPKSLKAFLDSTGGGLTFSFRLLKMIKQEKIWYFLSCENYFPDQMERLFTNPWRMIAIVVF